MRIIRVNAAGSPTGEISRYADGGVAPSPLLTRISTLHMQTPESYIADLVAPSVPVETLGYTGEFYRWSQPQRDYNPKRAQGGDFGRADDSVVAVPFTVEQLGLEAVTDQQETSAFGEGRKASKARWLTDLLRISKEVAVGTLLTTSGNYNASHTAALTGTSRWDDFDNSNPFDQKDTAFDQVYDAINRDPNTLIVGTEVWDKLRRHPGVRDRLGITNDGEVSKEQLASYFEVDRVLVGKGRKDTSKSATPSISKIWGKIALFAYIPPSPGEEIPALAYQLVKTGLTAFEYSDKPYKPIVGVFEERTQILGSSSTAVATTGATAGYLFTTVIS